MTDFIFAIVVLAAFFFAVEVAAWFKTLDRSPLREEPVPPVLGGIIGVALFAYDNPVVIGVLLTLAAIYVRHTGRASEPADGMIVGAGMGAIASVFAIFDGTPALLRFPSATLAGAVAGYGITFGLTHVRQKLRQLAVDAVTAMLAVGAAALPHALVRAGIAERQVAMGVAALIPLLIIATVFKQWPAIRAELRHEAALGVILDEDVRPTAHPLRRLGRAGWHDPAAHREFVRIANKIALRKRQQRGRPEEVARLYQLEVIKLRMELQEMTRIDRAMRIQSESEQQPAR
ncbi:MAG TPA: hypothetical protein VNI54_09170 [Thermoanaerobaculia bacterium]|nr:hypothetical protein [Thermoanaerobaculia bacterium]